MGIQYYRILKGGCPRGGGNWGTLRIPFGKIGDPYRTLGESPPCYSCNEWIAFWLVHAYHGNLRVRVFSEGIWIPNCYIHLSKTELNIEKKQNHHMMQNNNPYCISKHFSITNIQTNPFPTLWSLCILCFIPSFIGFPESFLFFFRPALAKRVFQANESSHCRWCAPPHCSTLK